MERPRKRQLICLDSVQVGARVSAEKRLMLDVILLFRPTQKLHANDEAQERELINGRLTSRVGSPTI